MFLFFDDELLYMIFATPAAAATPDISGFGVSVGTDDWGVNVGVNDWGVNVGVDEWALQVGRE